MRRIYRAGDRLVFEYARCTPHASLEGRVPEVCHDYWVIDPAGDVVHRYVASVWTIEDELGAQAFAVADGVLHEHVSRDLFGSPEVTFTQSAVLGGLEEVSDDVSRRRVEAAIAGREATEAREAAARQVAADGRIAAIVDARAELGAGPEVRRAQQALADRVHRYADERSAALLRTLIAFARRARASPALTAALETFATACTISAYMGEPAPPSAPVVTFGEDVGDLIAELRDHEQRLCDDADGQEQCDAMQNARVLRIAAARVELARSYCGSRSVQLE